MNLTAAFTLGAMLAAPFGFMIADKLGLRLPALPRRRYRIVDRKTGRVVRRFWTFGAVAVAAARDGRYPFPRFDIEKW